MIARGHFLVSSKRRKRGVAAIEFALGFFAFWSMCMLLVEMSYISYVSALGDVMITEASHQAKLDQADNFDSVFTGVIKSQDSLWTGLIKQSAFTTSITYVQSIEDLACVENSTSKEEMQKCGGGDISSPIAIYQLNYDYTPIFAALFPDASDLFSRETIVIQEYKRGQL